MCRPTLQVLAIFKRQAGGPQPMTEGVFEIMDPDLSQTLAANDLRHRFQTCCDFQELVTSKYRPGVVPRHRRNISMKALVFS